MEKRKMVVLPLVVNACGKFHSTTWKMTSKNCFSIIWACLKPRLFSFMPTGNQAADCISIYPQKPWGYFSNPETIVKSVTYKHEWWTRWNLPPQAVSEEAECAAWKICLHSEAGATDRIEFNIGYNPQTVGSVRGYTITALLPWQFISPAWDWTKLLHTSKAETDKVVEL